MYPEGTSLSETSNRKSQWWIAQAVAQHRLRMDLQGRLRNTNVAARHAFLPVLEAIINSVHSIEDRFGAGGAAAKGRIELHVRRVAQLPLPDLSGKGALEPVESFEIVDNGVGFDDPNLESFKTADRRFKHDRMALICTFDFADWDR